MFLAVVGSRTYSPYGKQVCEKLIAGLRGYPIVIVSGLALGIDGIAHQSALDAGLTTVAVPGSGLNEDVLYPATHRALARKILETNGALVSEFPHDARPRPYMFPQRNRIMAGMSHAVLVIEAEEKSGTLITSRLAVEYNRDVLAVPGPIHASTSKGPHMLLKRGAAMITESADILQALSIEEREQGQPTLPLDLSEDEHALLSHLAEPLPRDVLIQKSGLSATEANIMLSSLELRGAIEEHMGKVQRT